ncbi:MAG: hypothetical protein ABIP51_03590, partial [Bacteroidia bacterium]
MTKESAQNFLDSKNLSNINTLKSEYEKAHGDSLAKLNKSETAKIADSIKEYNMSTASALKKQLLDTLDKPVATRLLERAEAEKKINEELSGTIYATVGDDGNPYPISERINLVDDTPEYLKAINASFPITGSGATTSITDNVLNPSRVKYDFFVGGKKQTEQRHWVKQIDGIDSTASKNGKIVRPLVVDKTKFIGNVNNETSEYSKEILKNSSV